MYVSKALAIIYHGIKYPHRQQPHISLYAWSIPMPNIADTLIKLSKHMLASQRLPLNPVSTAQAMERHCLLSLLGHSTRPSSILPKFSTNMIRALTCWAFLRWCAQETPRIVTQNTALVLAVNVTNECAKESVYAGVFPLFRLTDQRQRVNWTRRKRQDSASVVHCAPFTLGTVASFWVLVNDHPLSGFLVNCRYHLKFLLSNARLHSVNTMMIHE